MLAATAGDLPVLVGGGSLLAVSIGFTLALMRQARRQYRDEVEARVELATELAQHRARNDVRIASDRARYDTLLEAANDRITKTEERERACNRRVDMLITACRQGGVAVPLEVWTV